MPGVLTMKTRSWKSQLKGVRFLQRQRPPLGSSKYGYLSKMNEMGWRYRFYAVRIWRKVSLVSKHFLEILILLDVAIMVSIFQTNPWLLQMLKSHLTVDRSKDLICPKASSSSPPASQQVATLSFQLLNWKILESLPWPLSLSVCLSVCLSLSLSLSHTHTHTHTHPTSNSPAPPAGWCSKFPDIPNTFTSSHPGTNWSPSTLTPESIHWTVARMIL